MTDILTTIARYKLTEIERAKNLISIEDMAKRAVDVAPARGFISALRRQQQMGAYPLIGELKKASPSKGIIRQDFDPQKLAHQYQAGGAGCLSVLTDKPSFQGASKYLQIAREATSLPVLRKDFILDSYQVFEARSWGADCILLILAMIDDQTASELLRLAARLGMAALVEVHDQSEMTRALALDCEMIGINNRDLRSFEVSLLTSKQLAAMVPDDKLVVSESGINCSNQLGELASFGIDAFLVGESLLRHSDVTKATKQLLSNPVKRASRHGSL